MPVISQGLWHHIYVLLCDQSCRLAADVANAQGGNNLATIEWFESGDCVLDKSIPSKAHTTVVTVEQQLCQTVPQGDGATAAGYQVTCDNNGGGTIAFYGSNACGPDAILNAPRQFTQGQCLPNAPGFGASSFRITCNPSVPVAVPSLGQGQFAALYHDSPATSIPSFPWLRDSGERGT